MASRRDVAGFLADCTGCPTINEIVIKAIEEAQRGGCCALLFVAVLEPFVGVEKKMWGKRDLCRLSHPEWSHDKGLSRPRLTIKLGSFDDNVITGHSTSLSRACGGSNSYQKSSCHTCRTLRASQVVLQPMLNETLGSPRYGVPLAYI